MVPPRPFEPRVIPRNGHDPDEVGPDTDPDVPALVARTIRHIDHVERQVDGLVGDMGTVKGTLADHSKALAEIGAAVIRIETRLGTTEALAKEAAEDAERAERNSSTNETDRELAKIGVAAARDALDARKEKRAALWGAFGKGAAFIFSVAGLTAIGGLALRACEKGPPPAEASPKVTSSSAAEATASTP